MEKKPIHKVIDGCNVLLPQVLSKFIALDENKANVSRLLSEVIKTNATDLLEHDLVIW